MNSPYINGLMSALVSIHFVVLLAFGLLVWASGCSALQPATKSQSMTTTAFGLPAIVVVSTTTQAATNSGDDSGTNTQAITNGIAPVTDVKVTPGL